MATFTKFHTKWIRLWFAFHWLHCHYRRFIFIFAEGSIAEGVFEQDDILLEFNSSIIRKALDLKVELNKFVAGSGDEIKAIVLRDGSQIEVVLKLK